MAEDEQQMQWEEEEIFHDAAAEYPEVMLLSI
jgi:hypothetical protein